MEDVEQQIILISTTTTSATNLIEREIYHYRSSAVGQGRASDSRLIGLGSNPVLSCKTLGKFFHSTLLQFTQLSIWLKIVVDICV